MKMKTITKDTEVTVKHILGETAEVLLTRLDNGNYKFNCDAYVIGERCKGGFFHLRQAREIIPGKELGNTIKFWPRLRKALHKAGLKPVNIPGGDYPIHYYDEIVIPDFSTSGSYYFVVKRADINTYLKELPLDKAGKNRADLIKKIKLAEAEEAYSREHDPKRIAERIGRELFASGGNYIGGEFQKITLVLDNKSEFSVIYPSYTTDLIWSKARNIAKVICTAPKTGIKFLSGWTAGKLDPRQHKRIKKVFIDGWGRYAAYLMPNPKLATEVREGNRWLSLFDNSDNDGVSPTLIASAKKVILEAYDLNDTLLKQRYVYNSKTKTVTKEYLQNMPFDIFNGNITNKLEWKAEEK